MRSLWNEKKNCCYSWLKSKEWCVRFFFKNHSDEYNILCRFSCTRPLFYWDHANNFSIIKCHRMMKHGHFLWIFSLFSFFIFAFRTNAPIQMGIFLAHYHTIISLVTFVTHFYDFTIMTNGLCFVSHLLCFLAIARGAVDKNPSDIAIDGYFLTLTIINEQSFFLLNSRKKKIRTHLLVDNSGKRNPRTKCIATNWKLE